MHINTKEIQFELDARKKFTHINLVIMFETPHLKTTILLNFKMGPKIFTCHSSSVFSD
jgi:hypothetical protein